ncbi:MAG: hypothetical protein V4548_09045 [Bacteroidota bacterium]
MKKIIAFSFFFFLSNFTKADTIPSWKVFYNSKLLKEIKLGNKDEKIKIDTLTYNVGDYIDISYNSFKEEDVYDIDVETESTVDLNVKYNNEKALLRTEYPVELFSARINDKSKSIRIDLEWIIDWLKEYPQYRIQVVLRQSNYQRKEYSSTKLFYIVNK